MADVIKWDPSYSVGVALLDEQHKRIVGMINRLSGDPDADVRSETVSDLLGELIAYAAEHFRIEERLLEDCSYPGLAEHKEQHRAFTKRVVELCEAATIHVEEVPSELTEFIGDWLVHHILDSDMQFRPYLEEGGIR